MKKKIIIGADHGGYEVKERIKKELGDQYEFIDLGTNGEESVDYPIYAEKVAQQVAMKPGAQGVIVCGSGTGVAITANKVHGIRAGVGYSKDAARLAREHNNANIITTAGREKLVDDPVEIVKTFLETDFSGIDRHERRVKQMMEVEKRNC